MLYYPGLYDIGTVQISYQIKGVSHPLWLVASRDRRHGGFCYLLLKSSFSTAIEVAKWAFKGYGLRWKIEEYHRHIKQKYRLEDVQLKTFDGIQSMLAILTVAMHMIYKKMKSLHFNLLLDAEYNYLNKHNHRELTRIIHSYSLLPAGRYSKDKLSATFGNALNLYSSKVGNNLSFKNYCASQIY